MVGWAKASGRLLQMHNRPYPLASLEGQPGAVVLRIWKVWDWKINVYKKLILIPVRYSIYGPPSDSNHASSVNIFIATSSNTVTFFAAIEHLLCAHQYHAHTCWIPPSPTHISILLESYITNQALIFITSCCQETPEYLFNHGAHFGAWCGQYCSCTLPKGLIFLFQIIYLHIT